MITAKINVCLIDKNRLFKGKEKDGKVPQYLDLVLIETPNNQYGDFMVCQSVSKEERANGIKGAILGNAKYVGGNSGGQRTQRQPTRTTPASQPTDDGQPPF